MKKLFVILIVMAVVTLTGYFALSPFLGLGGEFDNDYERNDLDNNYVQNELAIIFENLHPDAALGKRNLETVGQSLSI